MLGRYLDDLQQLRQELSTVKQQLMQLMQLMQPNKKKGSVSRTGDEKDTHTNYASTRAWGRVAVPVDTLISETITTVCYTAG